MPNIINDTEPSQPFSHKRLAYNLKRFNYYLINFLDFNSPLKTIIATRDTNNSKKVNHNLAKIETIIAICSGTKVLKIKMIMLSLTPIPLGVTTLNSPTIKAVGNIAITLKKLLNPTSYTDSSKK